MNRDDIADDLHHFADPYSPIQVEYQDGGHLRAQWTRRRQRYEAIFYVENDATRVEFAGGTFSYRQFLAHDELGGLRFLAETTLAQFHSLKRQRSNIETLAERGTEQGPAHKIISSSIRSHVPNGTTHVLFVSAAGGAGKTKVLEHVVEAGASEFLSGEAEFLYLYVNAQGRALAQVDEAFAVELDLLGAQMSFSAVSVLTRAGVLIPVIDGFDELIGAVGYDEAFQSLGRFIDGLGGHGQIVASARSAYYEREFQSRLRDKPRGAWSLDPVTLLPWNMAQRADAFEFVLNGIREKEKREEKRRAVENLEEVRSNYRDIVRDNDVFGRPFFAVQAATVLLNGETFDSESQNLIRSLATALLRREAQQKLLDRNHAQLFSVEQLWLVMRELAAEMWYQQTRALDVQSTDAVVALATDGWEPRIIGQLREKVHDLPLLSATGGRTEFAHENFFALFLADTVRNVLGDGGYSLADVLSRALLPEGISEQAVADIPNQCWLGTIARLNEVAGTDSLRSALIRENAGSLSAALVSQGREWSCLDLRGLVFGNVAISAKIKRLDLHDCFLNHTDLSELQVDSGNWEGAYLTLPKISKCGTSVAVSGLLVGKNVRGVRVINNSISEDVWEPKAIHSWLQAIGAAPAISDERVVDPETFDVIDRLSRAFLKSVFVATEDDVNASFMKSDSWPKVLNALVYNDIVAAETRAASGRSKIFYRCLVDPDDLMAGLSASARVPSKIVSFWDMVAHEAAD